LDFSDPFEEVVFVFWSRGAAFDGVGEEILVFLREAPFYSSWVGHWGYARDSVESIDGGWSVVWMWVRLRVN
jgi:hypothetical protein